MNPLHRPPPSLYSFSTLIGVAAIALASGSCAPGAHKTSLATQTPVAVLETETAVSADEKVRIRWLVDSGSSFGLGSFSDPDQLPARERVVADFNASQDEIELTIELIHSGRDTIMTLMAAGTCPDIIGPIGWQTANLFPGQWLDLTPYIQSTGFDSGVYDPALIEFYQTEDGQLGLPFVAYPAAVYYVPAMFDRAGLAYPPKTYGDKYRLDGTEVDWNWDTLAEVAKRLTLDANGRNATQAGFDATRIVQIGFSPQWQNHMVYQASFIAGGAKIVAGDAPGSYQSTLPDSWKEANRWIYEGMWGKQPFMATGPLARSPEFGNGNLFGSGKVAMAVTQLWYTCCLEEFTKAGFEFQAGILPTGTDGQIHGRVDADTFHIWNGTKYPEEAFKALSYLIGPEGIQTLVAGRGDVDPDSVYGGLPADPRYQQAYFDDLLEKYPFTTTETWEIFRAGLAYPDKPGAHQWQPNLSEAFTREQIFFDLLENTPPDRLDFDAAWQKMIDDLNEIYNK